MDDQPKKEGRELKEQEKLEVRIGQEYYEMTQTTGWKNFVSHLNTLAFHSWVDPRETASKEEWDWRELNAFHAASVAKDLMQMVNESIARANYLKDVEAGTVQDGNKMRI